MNKLQTKNKFIERVFQNETIKNYMDTCKELQVNYTLSISDNLEIKAEAKAKIDILSEIRSSIILKLRTTVEGLTEPNKFST